MSMLLEKSDNKQKSGRGWFTIVKTNVNSQMEFHNSEM